jgi:hypothetical protein
MFDVHAQWSCAAGSGLIIDMEFTGLMKGIHYVMFLVVAVVLIIPFFWDMTMLTGVLFPAFQGSLLPPFSAIQEALK